MTVSIANASTHTHTRHMGLAHQLVLWIVFATFALSGLVFTEPAPVDALMLGLCVLLPATRLIAVHPLTSAYLSAWFIVASGGIAACLASEDFAGSMKFTAVSVYLSLSSFVIAAFVTKAPERHVKLIFNGYLAAALFTALCGVIGYFALLPGTFDLFTKFGRAAGTFKDPNVFGSFLVLPAVYALHLALEKPLHRAALPLAMFGFLSFAVFVSFSRAAWGLLAISVAAYAYLSAVTTPSLAKRTKIAALAGAGLALATIGILAALQNETVANLLAERASLTQSYDVGPQGRFGGQLKAIQLILEHPFGIGAQEFVSHYHSEEAHNVYLSMMLNAGWVGGSVYTIIVLVTLALGFRYAFQRTAVTPYFQITYVCFAVIALEGLIIDSDHWRHFYLLLAITWGLMAAHPRNSQIVPVPGGTDRAQSQR